MGEYAEFNGREIKVGTCEDLYYLRADQAGRVRKTRAGHTNLADPDVLKVVRFRFPWPDEDGTEPGAFEAYGRSIPLSGLQPPADVDHLTVQFSARAGYLVSLPCPEGPSSHGLKIHRNGFAGPVRIVQQAYRGGNLAVICECGGCGARYNLPTLEDAAPVISACRVEANKRPEDEGHAKFWGAIADRIEAGYASAA